MSGTALHSCPSAWSSIRRSTGRRTASRWSPGTRRSFTKRTFAATRCSIRKCRAKCAAPSPAWPYLRSSTTSSPLASRQWSCCRSTHSSRTSICWNAGSPITGDTTPSDSSRRIRVMCATPSAGSPSSRRWCLASTMPASKSSSTSSTTILPRATSAARR